MLPNATKSKQNLVNVADNDNESDNDNVNDIDIKKNKGKTSRFTQPTLQEVENYIKEKGYSIDAEAFIAFYDSNGWLVGKNKMKSWKSAVTTWAKREEKQPQRPTASAKRTNNVNSIWENPNDEWK